MLLNIQWHQPECLTSKLYNEYLRDEYTDDDEYEQIIVTNVLEHVDLCSFEGAGIEEVKHLEEHEHVEKHCQMHTILVVPSLVGQSDRVWHAKHLVAFEKNTHEDYQLEDGAYHDPTPHLVGYQ